jgi:lipoyl(octanoyl) transferase
MKINFLNTSEKYLDFNESETINEKIHYDVVNNKTKNTVWFLQLKSVYTIGKSNIHKKPKEVDCNVISRGGDVTFHNEGQLLIYFYIKLEENINAYNCMVFIENAVFSCLKKIGCNAFLNENRGVWIKDQDNKIYKIASIGMSFKNKVSKYGIAINVNNDLDGFFKINPCGIEHCNVISLSQILKKKVNMKDLVEKLTIEILENFN